MIVTYFAKSASKFLQESWRNDERFESKEHLTYSTYCASWASVWFR